MRMTQGLTSVLVTGFFVAVSIVCITDSVDAQVQTPIAQYRSANFLIHSDMPAKDAEVLLEKLEAMLKNISSYWGVPHRRTIECNVIHDVANWKVRGVDQSMLKHTANAGGITIARTRRSGGRSQTDSTVWAAAQTDTTLHEAVHAYCQMNFGTSGPTWYSEGMAEIGHFWDADDPTVTAPAYVLNFLRFTPPPSLSELTALNQRTGDSKAKYAWRWAFCYMMVNNPNYADRFQVLGRGLLTKQRNATFHRMFRTVMDELEFEFSFFRKHVRPGFDAKLCAWNWKAKFTTLDADQTVTCNVNAKGGWQPSLLQVQQGQTYTYTAEGQWCTTADKNWLSADGTDRKSGRLVGTIYQEGQLIGDINLGAEGTFTAEQTGDLYLRCRDGWGALGDNEGRVTVILEKSVDGKTSVESESPVASKSR